MWNYPVSFRLALKAPLSLAFAFALAAVCGLPARAELKAGAAVVDITPVKLPVLVNGGFTNRSVDKVNTRLHARAIALTGGRERCVITVVDSCMMPRELLDRVKARAEKRTGIPASRMLISATHAHSAPSTVGLLGTDADAAYVPFLEGKLVEVIAAAQAALEPARVGFARGNAADFTASRQWIRRPDRIVEDPFGNLTVRANMHAARNWDDVTGVAGPEDRDLSLIAFQARDGRPLALLANFSMHYFGDKDLSADYYGLFCEGLEQRLASAAAPGKPGFVGIMSHGCSGDIWRCDYAKPEGERNMNRTIDDFAKGMVDIATQACRGMHYRDDADLAMVERRMTMNYRVPNKQLLEWAQRIVTELGGRPPKTQTEVYAHDQLALNERKQTEILVQALRIGDIAIASSPCETYAVTGLKIKAASPLPQTVVIELANGCEGYIPPPEQYLFGGYNTWPARSAGLEVAAEPKIAEASIEMLEQISGRPRRPWKLSDGAAARAILAAKPIAYWRLNEFTGPHAGDATGQSRDAVYEPGITFYLEGPRPEAFCGGKEVNRAPMFVGGRLRACLAGLGDRYSVSLWLWNGMPNDGRDVAGWLFSRGHDYGLDAYGDRLGVGGRAGHTGRLIFSHGGEGSPVAEGKTVIPRWEWRHLIFVRDGNAIRVYLNGELEIETRAAANFPAVYEQCFFGGRGDNSSNWEGRLDEVAVFSRALTADEVASLEVK